MENGHQITQYGEDMKQWGDTINNIFPNQKIHLKQWNPTFHVLNTNFTSIESSNIPVKENKSNNTYQVMGRQDQSHKNTKQDYFQEEYFQESSNLLHLEDTMVHILDIQFKNN